MRKTTGKIALLSILLSGSLAIAQEDDEYVKKLTIYGNSQNQGSNWYRYSQNMPGYAIVTKAKKVEFERGLNEVELENLPDQIYPSTVSLKKISTSHSLLEQEFIRGHLNGANIIKNNIGNDVEISQKAGDRTVYYRGTLLGNSGGLLLKDNDDLKIISDYASITFLDQEGDLINQAKSRIVWNIASENDIDEIIEYSFKTGGISWNTEYDLHLGEQGKASFSSWANIINNTRISAENAEIKLVAGDIGRSDRAEPMAKTYMASARGGMADEAMEMQSIGVSNESFSDFQMYRLGRPVGFSPNSIKKIMLYSGSDSVAYEKEYVFPSGHGKRAVESYVKFKNSEANGLGKPLPSGKYKIFEKSGDDFELAGEADFKHASTGDEIKLKIGDAFDLKGERIEKHKKYDSTRRFGSYDIEIKLESKKAANTEPVQIVVKEAINQQNWRVTNNSMPFKRINAREIEFVAIVAPQKDMIIKYSVEYSW
jgi:hypothetical protein